MRELTTSGNSLVAKAAIDCGCNFFGGYPITPSSEIAHELSVLLPKNDGTFIQMEDEIAGISVSLGAAMSGAKAMTASSGPGISLKSEQIGYAFIAEIPLVIVNVMRGGPSTGLPTRVAQSDLFQAKAPSHGDIASIVVCPASLEDTYSLTITAFNYANKYSTPVFLLLDETTAHMYSKAILPDLKDIKIEPRREFTGDSKDYKPYNANIDEPATLNPFFKGYNYHITGLHHDEIGFPTENGEMVDYNMKRLIGKVKNKVDEIAIFEEFMLDDAKLCIIAYGSVNLAAKEAILKARENDIKVGLFSPKVLYPLHEKKLKQITQKYEKILVIELNMGQYFYEIKSCSTRDDIELLCRANGRPIAPKEIVEKIMEICNGL